jgi:glycosyltransferase involved in cell wall biosynthesis
VAPSQTEGQLRPALPVSNSPRLLMTRRTSSRRKRIVMLQSIPHAHHPRHHYRLAAALADEGYEVVTMAPPDLSPGQRDAVPVRYLPSRGSRFARMVSGPLSVLTAARSRPTAVHVVSLDLLPWAVLLRVTGRCVVLYDSNEQYDTMMLIKDWLPSAARPLVQRLVAWLEPWLASQLDAATTALPATQEKFEQANVNSVLVRNFPPSELYADDTEARPSPDVDVLVGGTLPDDQIPLLVETAQRLGASGLGDIRWLVAARSFGAKEISHLETALEAGGVRRQFELHYNVPFAQMRDFMGRAKVALILYPGHANYGARIPLRIFEYMAAGLPFVASDLPTTTMFVRDTGTAVLTEPGSASAYADALTTLLRDGGLRERMSARGPVVAREHFNWRVESRKLTMLYRELIGPPA